MATILQAARRLYDQDAAFAADTKRTWQLVLGTLGAPEENDPPFSQTALFEFRCRAPQVANGERYDKTRFAVDLERGVMTCPAGQTQPAQVGRVVKFEGRECNRCPQKPQCTESTNGRSIAVHPPEGQLIELRRRQKTSEGQAELRKHLVIEHSLARVGQIQCLKARYCGVRRNLFDLRRAAVVANLFSLRAAGFEDAA